MLARFRMCLHAVLNPVETSKTRGLLVDCSRQRWRRSVASSFIGTWRVWRLLACPPSTVSSRRLKSTDPQRNLRSSPRRSPVFIGRIGDLREAPAANAYWKYSTQRAIEAVRKALQQAQLRGEIDIDRHVACNTQATNAPLSSSTSRPSHQEREKKSAHDHLTLRSPFIARKSGLGREIDQHVAG